MGRIAGVSSRHNTSKRIRKRAYHHGDLKAAMVEAALKLIARNGPRGFSLSEAARLAGVSVGAPYRHFADKEALLIAVAARGFIELWERIEAAGKTCPDNPRKRLVGMGAAYVRFAVERPSYFQVMFDCEIHRGKDPAIQIPADRCFQMLLETVRQAAARKETRTVETLTAAIWALMHGHAVFAMDNAFTNMEFETRPEILVHDSFEMLMQTPAFCCERG